MSDTDSPPSNVPTPRSKRDISPTAFRKACTLCHTPRAVLVRCQIDETGVWHFVCTGKCWKSVSGGAVDAAGHEAEFPFYRYGGMWKNKHEGVSAKKKGKGKGGRSDRGNLEVDMREKSRIWEEGIEYTRNDHVGVDGDGGVWVCRRSHKSDERNGPKSAKGYRCWKERDRSDSADVESTRECDAGQS